MKLSSEIKTAIIAIAALALFIWGINFLKGKDIFGKQRHFYAIYDRIEGLVSSNPVTINGMKVGQVSDIGFLDLQTGRIIIELTIDNEIPIPDNSLARIISSDLMGSKQIAILLGSSSNYLQPGDTMDTDIEASLMEEVNRQVAPLKKKAEDLMLSIDSMVTIVQAIFNENTRRNLEGSFESIRNSLSNLESTTYSIDTLVTTQKARLAGIISNVESISKNLRDNNEVITNVIRNFSDLTDSLAKADISSTLASARNVIEEISSVVDKINKGQGSMGLLLNDDELYRELESSSENLDLLIEDMRLNPQRYLHFSVFGKSAKRNQYIHPDSLKQQ